MEGVEQRNGAYYLKGIRVTLDSVVYAHLRGESPEEIIRSFPVLTLEQVKDALAFYEANRKHVHEYLEQQETEFDRMAEEARRKDPEFYARMDRARKEMLSRRGSE